MLLNFTVPIPKLKGKISRQGTKSGTYIHYVLERSYDQKKKHTVPKRVLIGKRVGETETMVPNENFLVFFPDAVLPEVRENARRCSTLMAGSYIVIANIVQTYGLGKMLQKHFLDRAGLVLDLAAYMIIEERNQGQYYPDYAYRHPLFSKDMRIASDAAISSFLSNVSPDQISGFLNDWNAKRDHRSRIYISYDSTNKTARREMLISLNSARPKSIRDARFLMSALLLIKPIRCRCSMSATQAPSTTSVSSSSW